MERERERGVRPSKSFDERPQRPQSVLPRGVEQNRRGGGFLSSRSFDEQLSPSAFRRGAEQQLHQPELMRLTAASPRESKHVRRHKSSDAIMDNNMSAATLAAGNGVTSEREKKRKHQIKTDQIIESLVWFSFHIPRTVLEDLISHELELWKRNNMSKNNRRDASTKRRKSKNMSKKAGSSLKSINNEESDGSLSSLSDDEPPSNDVVGDNYLEKLIRREHEVNNTSDMIKLPKAFDRESAILFVDMSGFTKLSTVLDVESLSKVINSYFDLIVSEVILFGGDILKFAGDAFFAEWRVIEDTDATADDDKASNPLSDLNASLASISDMAWDDSDIPPLSNCVMMAAKCATSIVKKFSDYHVTTADSRNTNEAMLNLHCGVGVGHMVGLHVRDYKDGQEEEAVELRREFLILGEPIDQVRAIPFLMLTQNEDFATANC